jgi:hypothetical protein
MERSLSPEYDSHSFTEQFTDILLNPQGSSLPSQEPPTCPYREPYQFIHTILSYVSKIRSNISLSPTSEPT